MADHLRDATKKVDFISREAAIAELCRRFDNTDVKLFYPGVNNAVSSWLNSVPAADVRPVKKAMCEPEGNGWTEHVMEYQDFRCHACGGFWSVYGRICEPFDKYSYCPRCGAELE